MIVARARVRERNYDRMRRVCPVAKPAQILIVEAKKRRQEIRVFLVEFVGMDSPFQLSITTGLITPQSTACWFTKDPGYEIGPF